MPAVVAGIGQDEKRGTKVMDTKELVSMCVYKLLSCKDQALYGTE